MEQSTNAGVPRGTLAALNHLGGVVILMLSSLLEFVCVLMLRLNDGVIGARRGARGDTSDVTSRRDPTGTPHDHSVNAQARPVSIAEIQAIEPAKVKAVQAAPAKPNATQPLDRTARAIEQKTVPATAKRIATREPQQAEAPESDRKISSSSLILLG